MKKELELTKEQEKVLEEFKAAVLKLRNADILPIENRYSNEILFINGKNIDKQWICLSEYFVELYCFKGIFYRRSSEEIMGSVSCLEEISFIRFFRNRR